MMRHGRDEAQERALVRGLVARLERGPRERLQEAFRRSACLKVRYSRRDGRKMGAEIRLVFFSAEDAQEAVRTLAKVEIECGKWSRKESVGARVMVPIYRRSSMRRLLYMMRRETRAGEILVALEEYEASGPRQAEGVARDQEAPSGGAG